MKTPLGHLVLAACISPTLGVAAFSTPVGAIEGKLYIELCQRVNLTLLPTIFHSLHLVTNAGCNEEKHLERHEASKLSSMLGAESPPSMEPACGDHRPCDARWLHRAANIMGGHSDVIVIKEPAVCRDLALGRGGNTARSRTAIVTLRTIAHLFFRSAASWLSCSSVGADEQARSRVGKTSVVLKLASVGTASRSSSSCSARPCRRSLRSLIREPDASVASLLDPSLKPDELLAALLRWRPKVASMPSTLLNARAEDPLQLTVEQHARHIMILESMAGRIEADGGLNDGGSALVVDHSECWAPCCTRSH